MEKFAGTIGELQLLVEKAGYSGAWSSGENGLHCFRSSDGAVLNWWNGKKKTVTFQGGEGVKEKFKAELSRVMTGGAPIVAPIAKDLLDYAVTPAAPRNIFVVHGHDEVAREQLERILLLLGLEPFVLQNTSGSGLTIIESLERQIGKSPEAEFGIVLMTPDDMGYSKKDGETKVQPRARQNVILEMGMLMSSLTRSRVAILVKGHIDLPSDASGIIYLHFNDHVKEVVPRLTDRLRTAGFQLDPAKISKAAT